MNRSAVGDVVYVESGGHLIVTNSSGQGTLEIRRGSVKLSDGQITAHSVVVSSNATLVGCGTIDGPVTNFGTIVADCPGQKLIFASSVVNHGFFCTNNGGEIEFQGLAAGVKFAANVIPGQTVYATIAEPGEVDTFCYSGVGGEVVSIYASKCGDAWGPSPWGPFRPLSLEVRSFDGTTLPDLYFHYWSAHNPLPETATYLLFVRELSVFSHEPATNTGPYALTLTKNPGPNLSEPGEGGLSSLAKQRKATLIVVTWMSLTFLVPRTSTSLF
jgi:hypothetical protein